MSFKHFAVLFFALALLAGCAKVENEEALKPPSDNEINFPSLMAGIDYEVPAVPQRTKDQVDLRAGVIEVMPGADQLQAIINAAPNNARIRLLPGTHTENNTLVIGHRLTLEGTDGATLTLNGVIGMYITGGDHVKVKDLTISNAGASIIGVAYDNADHGDFDGNQMDGFPVSVALEESNHSLVRNNVVVGPGFTTTQDYVGIVVVNGEHVKVKDNDVSENLFGIWACDKAGVASNNVTHNNLIGMILCNVPPGSFPLGTGNGGSQTPATDWVVSHNTANNNFWGYLVIDGSESNILNNNSASDNFLTDMELTFETTQLFGFFTPTSRDNTVNIGGTGIEVIDCGVNNTVNGGTPLSGPCSI